MKKLIAFAIMLNLIVICVFALQIGGLKRFYSPDERVHDLAQIWSHALNTYGYWNEFDDTVFWDNSFKTALASMESVESKYDYFCLLERFIADLQDGHGAVVPSDIDFLGHLNITLSFLDNQYVVTRKEGACPVPLYASLVSIDDIPVAQYVSTCIDPLVGVQTPLAREARIGDRICIGERGRDVTLRFTSPGGEDFIWETTYENPKNQSQYVDMAAQASERIYASRSLDLRILPGNIAHLRIDSFGSEAMLNEFYQNVVPRMDDVMAVIIDIRGNRGGNSNIGQAILETFTESAIYDEGASLSLSRNAFFMTLANHVNSGALREQPEFLKVLKATEIYKIGDRMLNSQYYETIDWGSFQSDVDEFVEAASKGVPVKVIKPCVMLIDERAISAADTVASAARKAGIPLIGTTTAGSTGDVFSLILSNGWAIRFTGVNAVGYSEEKIWNCGIVPDVYIEQTLSDIENRLDTQLEAALEYLDGNGLIEPFDIP